MPNVLSMFMAVEQLWSWSCHSGLGLTNLVWFTSLLGSWLYPVA